MERDSPSFPAGRFLCPAGRSLSCHRLGKLQIVFQTFGISVSQRDLLLLCTFIHSNIHHFDYEVLTKLLIHCDSAFRTASPHAAHLSVFPNAARDSQAKAPLWRAVKNFLMKILFNKECNQKMKFVN